MQKIETKIKTFPQTKVAFATLIGDYMQSRATWERLMKWAKEANALNEKTVCMGICYDDPGVTKVCKYEACITIPDDFNENLLSSDVNIKIISEHKCLSAIHTGPYKGLWAFYEYLYEKEPSKQHDILYDAPLVEIYHNTPNDTKEEDLITEAFIPIK